MYFCFILWCFFSYVGIVYSVDDTKIVIGELENIWKDAVMVYYVSIP
jgi:hypothetical protein